MARNTIGRRARCKFSSARLDRRQYAALLLENLRERETAFLAVAAGDELHGLMRGFLYAGAPALLISMWAADDAATTALMRVFYTQLLGGATTRDALRSAQRAAAERYPHPYYWAPFTLLGRAA